jgi:hypothetical protein
MVTIGFIIITLNLNVSTNSHKKKEVNNIKATVTNVYFIKTFLLLLNIFIRLVWKKNFKKKINNAKTKLIIEAYRCIISTKNHNKAVDIIVMITPVNAYLKKLEYIINLIAFISLGMLAKSENFTIPIFLKNFFIFYF